MAELQLNQIQKVYDKDIVAVDDFNLHIQDKEFIVFVGPSGCGKSTTLRMIAGLEQITKGELYIDGQLMNHVAPKDRNIAMVFQNYALYPHMNVYDNMAFGLKLRKFKKNEIRRRVNEAADILGLQNYLHRKPKALSGGQQQRVALGRAIVRDANVFLMDEPLSNLDAKLRVQMRAEIMNLHRKLETTTIYVTHDQTEAMTMATRIVVLNDGHIEQVGTPEEIYSNPKTMFVAGFIGAPSMNFVKGSIANNKPTLSDGTVLKEMAQTVDYEGEVVIGIRPEDIYLGDSSTGIPMAVEFVEMMGSDLNVHGKVDGSDVVIRLSPDERVKENDEIYIRFPDYKIHLFEPITEQSLYHGKEMRE